MLGFRRPLAFVCYHSWSVTIRWSFVAEKVAPIIENMHGIKDGDVLERVHNVLWHGPAFTRDDIDDSHVQNGYRSHKVSPETRGYIGAEDVCLVWEGGALRVTETGNRGLVFFVGFAASLRDAASWVATGNPHRLIIPWEGR